MDRVSPVRRWISPGYSPRFFNSPGGPIARDPGRPLGLASEGKKRMTFTSILDNIGDVFKDILAIATDAEPIVDTLFPTFGPLYNEAIEIITLVEAAVSGVGAKNAGKQKLAIATALLHPKVVAMQASLKIAPPSTAQTQAFVQSVVDGLKAYGAIQGKATRM